MEARDAFQCGNCLYIGLILLSIYTLSIRAQSISGFISIDCGSTPYIDSITKIPWEEDNAYISTGISGAVPHQVNSSWDNAEALQTFRYFPDRRSKHCYDLPTTTSNISFLLRAMFMHGSASELTLPIQFDVAVNGSTWFTISYDISDSYEVLTTPVVYDGIFHAPGSLTHFCLVPDTGVPFISTLELRQFDPEGVMYSYKNNASMYLVNLRRLNCGTAVNSASVRYPDDEFDRLWHSPDDSFSDFDTLIYAGVASTTTSSANNVPRKVMQDAWLNNSANSSFSFPIWDFGDSVTQVYAVVYFEEIVANASYGAPRVFHMDFNGSEYFVAAYRLPTAYSYSIPDGITNFTFTSMYGPPYYSRVGPIVNAVEVYGQFAFNNSATAAQDVDAMAALKASFNLTDWQGDPCFPVSWDWVTCTQDTPARVDTLLLSSMGIHGSIPPTISDLDALTQIHLDHNSLNGTIPDSLASLPNLTGLHLNDNDLSGDVPPDLITKLGSNFDYSGNSLLGTTSSSKKKSSNIGVVIAAVAGGIALLAVVLGILIWYFCSKKKKLQQKSFTKQQVESPEKQSTPGPSPSWQFKPQAPHVEASSHPTKQSAEVELVSFETVQIATNHFSVKIGHGSYGSVFHGWLNDREVAVKLNNIQSEQGHNEFITEVDILTRVHHRNLVSLIGYCDEGKERILIYEFEVNGTLREWIHDEAKNADESKSRGTLDWKKRLQIAADGARGLEYLHKGCHPTIIHRDVKSSNILLDESMTAKVADFGLSKSVPLENTLGYSTGVKGTPGYLDPEYHQLGRLTHKSDVYSYGVVLAELITGRPPFKIQSETSTIILVDYLRKMVERNDIEALADPKLGGSFNIESMRRMADIALSCVDPAGVRRPDFTQVVNAISEAIELEKSFTVHSPLPPSRTILTRSGSVPHYQNLQL